MANDLFRRALASAAAVLEDEAALVNYVRLDLVELAKWSRRRGSPPAHVSYCLGKLLGKDIVRKHRLVRKPARRNPVSERPPRQR